MSNTNCDHPQLFEKEVGSLMDELVSSLFSSVSKRANKNLSNLKIVDSEAPINKTDFERQMKNALLGSFSDALNPKVVADIKSRLANPLPCRTSELKQQLNQAPMRDIEDDLALIIAYGYQHGLNQNNFKLLPGRTMSFEFHAASDLSKVELHAMQLNVASSNRGKYLSSVRTGESITKSGARYEKTSSKEEFIKYVLTLAIPLLFECLKWVFEKLYEALTSGDDETVLDALDDAIEKAEDVLDDVEDDIDDVKEEIDDLDEEIKELEEELKDEDDKDDREDLRDDIKEKKDERKEQKKKLDDLKEAEKKLEKGISRLKEARQKLR